MQTSVALVSAGFGVALVPASLRRFANAAVSFRELADLPAELHVDLAAVHRAGAQEPALRAFLEALPGRGEGDAGGT